MKQQYKVMIVDDQAIIRMMLRKVLASSGYCVFDVADGTRAVEIAQEEKPDIALVDVNIPGLSGINLLKHLREVNSQLATIFMSGSVDCRFLEEANKAGATGFLQKPFDIYELTEWLDDLTASRLVAKGRIR